MLRLAQYPVVAIAILAISLACVAEATIPSTERAALIGLYNSTDGANWSRNTGWLGAVGTECDWYGVTCNAVDDKVSRLSLPSNNLSGEIPSGLAALYLMTKLKLQGNHLTGTIPSQFRNFWVIEEIDLSDNELTGSIPSSLGDKASGYRLQRINLANNQLTGTIPSSLGDHKALKYLTLSGNQLTGAIPSELSNLYPLQSLKLSGNQLSGAIPLQLLSITKLPNLVYLHLDNNKLTGTIPRQLVNLTSLDYIYLQGNKFTGTIPPELADLTFLRGGNGLDLRWNSVSTSSSALAAFLDTKQVGGDWQSTQTLPPTGVSTSAPTHDSVTLNWTPILYTADDGFYQVLVSEISGGPYSAFETVTTTKSVSSLSVSGLEPETTYFFVVKTTTEAHPNNLNELVSATSAEVSAMTNPPPVYADIGVAVLESLDPVHTGDEVSYTITAENNGPSEATGVELSVELTIPDHVNVNSVLPGKGIVSGTAPTYTWAIGGLANGESSDLDIVLAVESEASGGTGVIAVEVLVTALTETDPLADNDHDSESTSVVAVIPAAERSALLALYDGTAGPSWTTRTNWGGATATECTWFGVTCNAEGKAVVGLELENNNLSGTIPPALGNLTSLQELHLESNDLVGIIPGEIGNLSSMRKLHLHVNGLTGSIPSELGSLTFLVDLRLKVNQLSGPIPSSLGNLSSLEILSLESNRLTEIPPELGNLGVLQELRLSGNEFSGSIPPELGNLDSVMYFMLVNSQLSGSIPPELGNLASVLNLNLSGNQLTGSIPPELGNLNTLTTLYLFDNQLSGNIPPELGNLGSIDWLQLHGNELSGNIPPELGNLSSLRYLYLSSNQLSGEIPPELGNLDLLSWLILADNNLDGEIPHEISSMNSLTWLDLSSNQFNGDIPADLTSLAGLLILDFSSNQLTGRIPSTITNLSNLYADRSDFRWNAFFTEDDSVATFLNGKQEGGDWQGTQTIAPLDLTVTSVEDHSVWLSWSAVTYTDPGGYELFFSPGGADEWTSAGWTDSKSTTSFPVTGLDPSLDYDFVVTSFTHPHVENLNELNSDAGVVVSATTSGIGCASPFLELHYGSETTLSVTSPHDTFNWSTGETSSSISVDPPSSRWYWVSVSSTGGCQETASTFVDANPLIVDGFESGDCDSWSSVVGLAP